MGGREGEGEGKKEESKKGGRRQDCKNWNRYFKSTMAKMIHIEESRDEDRKPESR